MAKVKFGQPIPKNHVVGATGRQEFLPHRFALAKLTKGDPFQRSIGMYAKATPSGAGAPGNYADIQAMGEKGIDANKK